MKTKLLFLTALLATSFQFINAQCSRTGTFVQSDPAYSISGSANITFTTSGNKDVIFEPDFATVQGADLRVYLSKTEDIATTGSDAVQISSQLMNDAGGTSGPGVSPITGMMTFPIPVSIDLEEFDFIVIQCIAINERWGHVSLGTASGSDCNTLSIDENELSNSISFFPNPADTQIEIANPKQLDLNVSIYGILGKKVLSVNNTSLRNQNLNLTSLNSGVYLLEIKAEGKTITKKLVKQ